MQIEPKLSVEQGRVAFRLVEADDKEIQDTKPSLPLLHRVIIYPVADLLKESEIIISWSLPVQSSVCNFNGRKCEVSIRYLQDSYRFFFEDDEAHSR